jgi:hypothetical protein
MLIFSTDSIQQYGKKRKEEKERKTERKKEIIADK